MVLPLTDTRFLFRPLSADLVALLGAFPAEAWGHPTLAGSWRVRDVVAHMVDGALRRLSFHRDGGIPPGATGRPSSDRELAARIDGMNAAWVRASERLSPRVLTELYARASSDLADFVEGLDPNGPALFPVSWAGESESAAWLDIGREFTEVWHHAAQVREAAGAGPFPDARWLHAVLALAVRAVPPVYRGLPGFRRPSVVIDITGESGGTWTLLRRGGAWGLEEGEAGNPTARATMSDEVAWRLFFNALPPSAAADLVRLEGDRALGLPLLGARSVIVQRRPPSRRRKVR